MPKSKGINLENAKEPILGKYYFLGIGIDRYQQLPNLFNAVRDVKEVSEILLNKYTFEQQDTILLFDEQATRDNILDTLSRLSEQVSENDNLIIYYSGHGKYNQIIDLAYWLLFDSMPNKDYTGISNDELSRFVKSINSKHTWLISDSCFSGSLIAKYRFFFFEKLNALKSRWVTSSGRFQDLVIDGKPGNNSPFAKALIVYLKNNKEEYISLSQINQYLIATVASNSEQIPVSGPLRDMGHEGGELVICLRNTNTSKQVNEIEEKGEYEMWRIAAQQNNISAYNEYLKKYEKGEHALKAKEKIIEIEREKFTFRLCRKKEHFSTYIALYPNGIYLNDANKNLEINIISIVAECKKKLMDGDFNKVYKILFKEIIELEEGKEYWLQISQLSSRWSSLRQENNFGVVDYKDYNLMINQLNKSALELLDEIENE